MRTLAIGDIHGCFTALTTLIAAVSPSLKDRLVFLGDYIDRGPRSRDVIDWLIRERDTRPTAFIRGNHEVMILDARTDPLKSNLWQSYGGFETILSYEKEYSHDWAAAIPGAHWDFIRKTIPLLETSTHIFVHACLDPAADLKTQPDWLLYWECFERIQPHKSGKTIICGHTSQSSGLIKDAGFAVCIDTDPARGGWLTCLDPVSGQYWQANEDGQSRGGQLKRP